MPVLDDLIDRIEAGDEARPLLRPHRGAEGLCDAFLARLLAVYAADPVRADRLAGQWRVFLELGDDPAKAYRAKGISDRFRGRWLASARAFLRAGELARDRTDRSAYALGAIESLARAGRVEEAVVLGERLARELDVAGAPLAAARARLNTANALIEADRDAEARRLYAQAIPVFASAEMAFEESCARLGLSTSHLYGGDPAITAQEADASLALAQTSGLEFTEAICEYNLAFAALVQGRPDEAFARLLALRPRLEDHPCELARADLAIGDACLRLNLFDEAVEAYAAALASGDALRANDRAYALFGLGEAKAVSEAANADVHLRQAAARWRAIGNSSWHAAALAARATLRPQGRHALRHADRALEAAGTSPYHETLARLARAETLAVRGREVEGDLRRAHALARRYGYRRFAWRVHAMRARVAAAPLRHHRRMFAEILRERLAVTSVAARTGFLKDKSGALGAYLAFLLRDPTPRRVAEAREAIRQTRAVTLLDEILSGGSLPTDSRRLRRLEEFRAQITRDLAEESLPGARNVPIHTVRKRAWTEATHVLGALDAVVPPDIAEGCVMLAEADGHLWAIIGARAIPLPMTAAQLEDSLRWLRYEIQAPTADPTMSPQDALALLDDLREALVRPWLDLAGGLPTRLCPDGLLWRVPWDALLDGPTAASLLLHPSLAGGRAVGTLGRVAIWVDHAGDLPNAISEELTVLARFPDAMVFRTRKEILDSVVEDWDLVHVVGHAHHNPGNPMFSALEFPDGPLYAAEIARCGLRVRLACLSACETGTLSFDARQEPDGLVRAFLARGAEAVVASLWPLDDAAASRFFSSLYADLAPDTDLALAVHKARQNVRNWRGHPYFWASLTLFAGYQP